MEYIRRTRSPSRGPSCRATRRVPSGTTFSSSCYSSLPDLLSPQFKFTTIPLTFIIVMQRYLIGTLFEEEEHNKKMNINTVKAKDPNGNTRWKGAFTGGFEAGYRNTCGSKDGWVPATFVSSVLNRAEKKDQNIFDYMDKEDLGRESIGENISLRQGFVPSVAHPLGVSTGESVGERILAKLKKKEAFETAPEDIKDLHKLLQNYEEAEAVQDENYKAYTLKGVDSYNSVGTVQAPMDDDFIAAYEDFFKKVIRTSVKEESEEERAKRMEENKVYFDFSKPLQSQPDYLKEIQQVEDVSQPKKRRNNVINHQRIKDVFKTAKVLLKPQGSEALGYDVPEDYDPYHRLKDLQAKDNRGLVAAASEQKLSHKVQSLSKRSDLLGEGKLNSRFVSAGGSISGSKFVRSGQEKKGQQLQKVFQEEKKNQRYWDYVMEMEGKKISAQLEYLDYEEAEREKIQFQKLYRLKSIQKKEEKSHGLGKKLQEALSGKKKEVKVVRTTGTWKPQRLLCKRFGCMMPYKEQKGNKSLY